MLVVSSTVYTQHSVFCVYYFGHNYQEMLLSFLIENKLLLSTKIHCFLKYFETYMKSVFIILSTLRYGDIENDFSYLNNEIKHCVLSSKAFCFWEYIYGILWSRTRENSNSHRRMTTAILSPCPIHAAFYIDHQTQYVR